MEKETKTVTIPISEFEEMRSKAAMYNSLRTSIKEELEREYEVEIKALSKLYNEYYDKYSKASYEAERLELEIGDLKSKLEKKTIT